MLDKETRRIYLQKGVTSKESVALSNIKDYIWIVNIRVYILRKKKRKQKVRKNYLLIVLLLFSYYYSKILFLGDVK